ncbi:MAG TPA: hypothetical protein VGC06_15055, partial [Actinomycetes bacterium]
WHARGQGFKSPQLHREIPGQTVRQRSRTLRVAACCQQVTARQHPNRILHSAGHRSLLALFDAEDGLPLPLWTHHVIAAPARAAVVAAARQPVGGAGERWTTALTARLARSWIQIGALILFRIASTPAHKDADNPD